MLAPLEGRDHQRRVQVMPRSDEDGFERGIIENFLRVCRAIAKSKSTSGSLSGEAGGVGQAPELDPANLAEGGKKFRSTETSGSDPAENNAFAARCRLGNGDAHARAARGRFGPEGHAPGEGS